MRLPSFFGVDKFARARRLSAIGLAVVAVLVGATAGVARADTAYFIVADYLYPQKVVAGPYADFYYCQKMLAAYDLKYPNHCDLRSY